MRTMQRLLLAAGLLATAPGLGGLLQAQEPIAPPIVAPAEPIAPPALTSDTPEPTTQVAPMPVDTTAAKHKLRKEKERGSTLTCLKNWLCYTPSRLPCECGWQATSYRPPLYTWFTCTPGTCVRTSPSPQTCAQPPAQPLLTSRRYEEPLPKVEMPAIVKKDQPLVSGSVSVMADRQEQVPFVPVNYKSLPVTPEPSGRR